MKNLVLGAVFAIFIVPGAALPQDSRSSLSPLQVELIEAEVSVERLRPLVRASFDITAERYVIDRVAKQAELSSIEVRLLPGPERVFTDDEHPVPLELNHLEIAGRGSYPDINFFLRILGRRALATGVDSVRLHADSGDNVRFVARVVFPTWADTPRDRDIPRDASAALRQNIARAKASRNRVLSLIRSLRADGQTLEAMSAFTQAVEDHAIALTTVQVADVISIEGFLLGAAARAVLPPALDKARLQAGKVVWSAAGTCHAFSMTVSLQQLPASETEDDIDSGGKYTRAGEVFDGDSAAFCRGEPQERARRIVVKRPASSVDTAFFLRLRDVTMVDVFFVLNDLFFAHNFVVDESVNGRVDLDVPYEGTLEELYGALNSDEVVIGSGPLRRVSRDRRPVTSPRHVEGEPIDISLRDVDLAGILCLLGRAAEREIRMPPDLHQRVSIFAENLPIGVALDELVPSSSATTVNACDRRATESRPRLALKPLNFEQIGIDDLRVAGLARSSDDTWRGYVYAPGRQFMSIESGQRLFDGSVKSIGPKGITFLSDAKDLIEVPFPPADSRR